MSLRTKFILAFLILVVGVAASLILFISLDNTRQVQNFMVRGGMFGIQDIVSNLEKYYAETGSWVGVETVIDKTQQMGMMNGMDHGIREPFTLTDPDLTVLWSSEGKNVGEVISGQGKSSGISLKNSSGNVISYLFVTGRSAVQESDISPLLSSLKTAVVRVGIIAIVVALIFAVILSNRLIKPIKMLTGAAQSLSTGNLSARVKESGNDEIALLGKTFNEMAEHLQQSEVRKKALTADIAHELRSPLAVQRAQLEAMQDGIVPMNVENLQTVVDQTNFLARLVDDLRTLALVDAGELPLELQEVNLPELIQQVVERFQPQTVQHKVTIEVGENRYVTDKYVMADSDRLVQIFSNLLSNALNHTPENGRIVIDLFEKGNTLVSTVSDTGCGVPEESLAHIFERFYRGDKSRNHEFSSTGLGLSIARNLARVHGGDLVAANGQNGGAVFTFTLPLKKTE